VSRKTMHSCSVQIVYAFFFLLRMVRVQFWVLGIFEWSVELVECKKTLSVVEVAIVFHEIVDFGFVVLLELGQFESRGAVCVVTIVVEVYQLDVDVFSFNPALEAELDPLELVYNVGSEEQEGHLLVFGACQLLPDHHEIAVVVYLLDCGRVDHLVALVVQVADVEHQAASRAALEVEDHPAFYQGVIELGRVHQFDPVLVGVQLQDFNLFVTMAGDGGLRHGEEGHDVG